MKIAVLGCGNMASAIVKSVYAQNSDFKFFTYTPTQHRAVDLAAKVNGECFESLEKMPLVDMVLIACKPQQFNQLSEQLRPFLISNQIIVSILAATDLESIQKKLATKNVVRIMPNTPCEVSQGISLMLSSDQLDVKKKASVKSFFELCSCVIEVQDDQELDLLTVVSGSGPAYVFEFASGMQKFLISKGIDKELSKKLIDQLFLGSSLLMQKSHSRYNDLVDAVTSKAGVTIEAINTYRQSNLSGITDKALNNALERSEQINQEIKSK